MSQPLVIFDLDGTLLHTAPDLLDSLNHTISSMELAPVTFDDITYLVGSGARVMIDKALQLRNNPVSAEEFEALFALFLTHYSASMPGRSEPYPGVLDAMARLEDAGYALAVCTNKTEIMAHRLLELTGLMPRFKAVTGGDTFAVRKPDAGHIHGTIDMAGAHPSLAVMIGDSVNDVQAAANAGIPSIGIPFGYSDTAMENLGPDEIIGHYNELTPELVGRLLERV
ncbi:HAD family hydrolase [Hoeflea prorocentri]|uniref:Phosphoglycolate phosphatase n=1 Tax=Hoeflea prorocentri TaxID=1922333 RepID=A0A9X3UFG6_9HYPH|nr:HAD family hydrolase [Hoeflea prorocentri]MCY6380297.1 phosphoglycolate phosphatase [Hoeflea prorocentri]MDA5398097.1 phosphoglycolate phosphatase [Hoeflea prorocentri]